MSVPARLRWLLPGHSLLPVLACQGCDIKGEYQILLAGLAVWPRLNLPGAASRNCRVIPPPSNSCRSLSSFTSTPINPSASCAPFPAPPTEPLPVHHHSHSVPGGYIPSPSPSSPPPPLPPHQSAQHAPTHSHASSGPPPSSPASKTFTSIPPPRPPQSNPSRPFHTQSQPSTATGQHPPHRPHSEEPTRLQVGEAASRPDGAPDRDNLRSRLTAVRSSLARVRTANLQDPQPPPQLGRPLRQGVGQGGGGTPSAVTNGGFNDVESFNNCSNSSCSSSYGMAATGHRSSGGGGKRKGPRSVRDPHAAAAIGGGNPDMLKAVKAAGEEYEAPVSATTVSGAPVARVTAEEVTTGADGSGAKPTLSYSDEEILTRIADVRTLREAEILLYDIGQSFRSGHAAALLGRLPDLDLGDSNAGPRTRHLIRFLTHGTLTRVDQVSGPALARCVAAFARLHYAPPQAVPYICSALLAAHDRKLRACRGPDLAALGWGLAALQLLYGDLHQAVQRPYTGMRLPPGSRVVGYVREAEGVEAAAASGSPGEGAGVRLVGDGEGGQVQSFSISSGLSPEVGDGVDVPSPACREEAGLGRRAHGYDAAAAAAGVLLEASGGGLAAALETASSGTRSAGLVDSEGEVAATDEMRADGSAASGVVQLGGDIGPDPSSAVTMTAAQRRWRRRRGAAAASSVAEMRVINEVNEVEVGTGGGEEGDGGRDGKDRKQLAKQQQQQQHSLVWLVPSAMDRIWNRLAAVAGSRDALESMEGEDLAKLAWAYAKVRIHKPDLYEKIAAATLSLLAPYLQRYEAAVEAALRFNGDAAVSAAMVAGGEAPLDPVTVTNLVWAFVTNNGGGRRQYPLLMGALAAVAAPYKGSYDGDLLANLARSYASAGYYNRPLCTAFAMVACRRVRHLPPPQFVALVGSLGALGHRDEQLGAAMARAVRDKREEMSAEEVAEMLWACAQLGINRPTPTAAPGVGVLGLEAIAATPAPPSAANSRQSSWSRRQYGGPAVGETLAAALSGHCDGLPPGALARTLWALSVLPLSQRKELRPVLMSLVKELSTELGRHPHEAFSQEALVQLYGAAYVLAEVLPPVASAADELANDDCDGEEDETRGGESGWDEAGWDEDEDGMVEDEGEGQQYARRQRQRSLSSDARRSGRDGHGAPSSSMPGAARGVRSGGGVVRDVRSRQLFGDSAGSSAAAAGMMRGLCTATTNEARYRAALGGVDADNDAAGSGTGGVGSSGGNAARQEPTASGNGVNTAAGGATTDGMRAMGSGESGQLECGTQCGVEVAQSDRHIHRQQRPQQQQQRPRRRRNVSYDNDKEYDPYDASWSNVDWGALDVPPPSGSHAGGAAASPVPSAMSPERSEGIRSRGRAQRVEGKDADGVRGRDAAASGVPPPPPLWNALAAYDMQRVSDEASGQDLIEIVPKAGSLEAAVAAAIMDGDGGDGVDPAGRLLPPALLHACQAAAAEWAAAEQRRLEVLEEGDSELWRVEVAGALRDLLGREPLHHWTTPQRTAVADLLVLPPEEGATGRGTRTHGSHASPPPRAPLAVLLLGPQETTRNPPYVPLGTARSRQLLLEAAGVRVLVLPRFLWRMMESSPADQLTLLGNLLGGDDRRLRGR